MITGMQINIDTECVDNSCDMVLYNLSAETNRFKGYTEFYGDSKIFQSFAENILNFPFVSQDPIELIVRAFDNEPVGTTIRITLVGKRGEIELKLNLCDEEGNTASFSDYPIETQSLHNLAHKILETDFSTVANSISWKS